MGQACAAIPTVTECTTAERRPRSQAGMTDDRLDWHLWSWANWHRTGKYAASYPSRASGGIGKSNSSDFDAMVAAVDARCAFAVDTALWDCSPAQRAAVFNRHLDCVYVIRDEEQHYNSAREHLKKTLTRHGID
jgi:hypothetical protein